MMQKKKKTVEICYSWVCEFAGSLCTDVRDGGLSTVREQSEKAQLTVETVEIVFYTVILIRRFDFFQWC